MRKSKKLLSMIIALCISATTFTYVPTVANAEEALPDEMNYAENTVLLSFPNSLYDDDLILSEIDNTINDNLDVNEQCSIMLESSSAVNSDTSVYTVSLDNYEANIDILELCERINSENNGMHAMPNYRLDPDDVVFDENIGLNIDELDLPYTGNYFAGWHLDDIYADVAEDICENYGDGVVVAVIDSGCDFSHEHLNGREVNIPTTSGRIVNGFNLSVRGGLYDVDDNFGHGTKVSSVIAGSNNSAGFYGVAKNAKILPIKISDQEEGYYVDKLIQGLDMIAHYNHSYATGQEGSPPPISVVNISMSCEMFLSDVDINNPLKQSIETVAEDCVIVASAGNRALGIFESTRKASFPAAFESVIGVMGSGTGGIMLKDSCYDTTGLYYDIVAPAEGINVAIPSDDGNSYEMKSGTSYSSAIIAGAIALYLSNCPESTIEQARNNLINDVVDKVKPYYSLDIPHPKFNIVDYLKKGLISADSVFTGGCGPNATWTYNHSNRSLTISGEGEMYDYALVNSPWFDYRRLITSCVISDDITEIGDGSFSNLSALKNLTIGNNVIRIGSLAFSNCKNITAINIPSTVVEIGMGAFYNCSSAQTVTLPLDLTTSGQGIFQKCSSLTSVTIPNEWTEIPTGMFLDCSSLQSVELPDTITLLGSISFKNCTNLHNINMPENLLEIKPQAFANCSSLSSLIMPRGLTEIYGKVFSGCTNLRSITLYDNITAMGSNIFEDCNNVTVKAYINSTPLNYAQNNNIDYEIMYRLNSREESTTVFDRNNGRVFGLKQSLTKSVFQNRYVQLDDGYTLAYELTNTRYMGTDSIVKVMRGDTVVETYKVLVFGELNGDGRIDTRDVSIISQIINGDYVLENDSLVEIAADVYQHGSGVTVEDREFLSDVVFAYEELSQNLYTPV